MTEIYQNLRLTTVVSSLSKKKQTQYSNALSRLLLVQTRIAINGVQFEVDPSFARKS